MKILVTGSTGLVGSDLVLYLTSAGHRVVRLVRSRTDSRDDVVVWDPAKGQIDSSRLEKLDAVVHLAGENIAVADGTTSRKPVFATAAFKGRDCSARPCRRYSARRRCSSVRRPSGFTGSGAIRV